MGIMDAGMRACELCGGPRMTFLDSKSNETDHFCEQCGTNDVRYYDCQEDCSVSKHYRRYGIVYKIGQKGYEETHTSFAEKPTREEVLAVFEDLRQTQPEIKKAYGYAEIDGEWLRFDLDGTVTKSTLSDDVEQIIADYYKHLLH